jgi:hypothetical protein
MRWVTVVLELVMHTSAEAPGKLPLLQLVAASQKPEVAPTQVTVQPAGTTTEAVGEAGGVEVRVGVAEVVAGGVRVGVGVVVLVALGLPV